MPRYEYVCSRCNQNFDVTLTYDQLETADLKCPHCGSDHLRQKLSKPSFTVKGKHALTREQIGLAMGVVDQIGPQLGACSDNDKEE